MFQKFSTSSNLHIHNLHVKCPKAIAQYSSRHFRGKGDRGIGQGNSYLLDHCVLKVREGRGRAMFERVPPLPKSPHDTCTKGWPKGMRGGVKGEDPARVPRDCGVEKGQLNSSNGPP